MIEKQLKRELRGTNLLKGGDSNHYLGIKMVSLHQSGWTTKERRR
jgi:hypothetical protein